MQDPNCRYHDGVFECTDAGTGPYVRLDPPIYGICSIAESQMNCLAAAIREPSWKDVGQISNQELASMRIEDVAAVFVDDVKAKGWTIIKVSDPDYRLHEQYGEYLVALRTGEADYHFMYCENGIWYQKCGHLPIETLGKGDPSQWNWDKPWFVLQRTDAGYYECFIFSYYPNYYNSETVFFAITPN